MSLIDNVMSEAGHVLSSLEPQFHVIGAWCGDSKQVLGNVEVAERQVGAKDLLRPA
jgi:hypothetical protein